MKGRSALKLVVVMALLSAAAIIGLLLAEGVIDTLLLLVAALPLAVGLWRWRAEAAIRSRPDSHRR